MEFSEPRFEVETRIALEPFPGSKRARHKWVTVKRCDTMKQAREHAATLPGTTRTSECCGGRA